MRYLFIVFLFLAYASTGQVIRTAGIALGTTVPTHTPTAQGALKYYNYSSGTTYKWYNSAWVVEATGSGSDDQNLDTFDIVSNTLRISVEDDGVPFYSVDLSPYLDDTDTQLSEEQVEDYVGGMTTGNTVTLITVTYQDADGTIDFEVENDLSLYDNSTSGFLTSEVDGSVTNEIQYVDTLVLSGTTLGISLYNDAQGQKTVDLSSLQDGTGTDDQVIDTFDIAGNQLRLSVEDDDVPAETVDLSPYLDNTDAQGLTIGGTGPYTVDISGGADVTIEASGITTLSEPSANVLRLTTTEVDGSTTNEIQNLDTFTIVSNVLRASLLNDGIPFSSVDLSPYLDDTDTDNQIVDTFTIVSNVLRLSLQDDAVPFEDVDLSPYLDNTDAQTLSFSNPNLSISGGNSVNISGIDTDTDDQGLTIGGSGPTYTVDIDGGADVTIAAGGINALSEGTANILTITATEVDGSTTNEIQDLSLTVNTLALSSDASTVDLSGYLDNTDDQGLTVTGSGPDYVINQEDGTDITVSAAGIATLSEPSANELRITATEVDGSTTNELQTIDTFTIVSNVLRASLLNDGVPFEDVDLSPYLDNTDAQGFTVTDDGTTFDFDLSGTASDFALVEGTGITLSRTGNDVTIESTGGADDQNLTITGSGPDYVVDIESGNDVTISAAGITTLSEGTANVLTITSTEVDGSTSNELQDLTIGGSGPTYTVDIASGADVTIAAGGIVTLSEGTANTLTVTATEAQTFSGSDDGTTFTLDLSGAATDIAFKEGSNVTITRTGTELTFASTGSADNWGTDVVNKNGTLTGDGTVASVLKVDTTVISTKDFVYKGKVTQESSETIKTTNFTAVKTVIHPVDCSAGAITVTPPSSPAIGDRFAIVDSEAQAATNNITIDFTTGSYKLYTAVQNYIINVAGGYVEFIYMGSTTGWIATKG